MATKKEPEYIIEVQLEGEVYSRRYAMTNIQMVIDLVNEMFENEIKISLVKTSVREIKKVVSL